MKFIAQNKILFLTLLFYFVLGCICLAERFLWLNPSDTMGYALVWFYVILPIGVIGNTAIWIMHKGGLGVIVGVILAYLNGVIAGIVFDYDHPLLIQSKQDLLLLIIPVIVGIIIGVLLFTLRKGYEKKKNVENNGKKEVKKDEV